MQRVAEIKNGTVISLAIVGSITPAHLSNWTPAPDNVQIGYLYDGLVFTAPAAPAPSADPRDYNLNRVQFLVFMSGGYDDALAAIMPALKIADVALWAKTKNDMETAQRFHFAGIIGLLANPAFASLIPATLDVTEITLSAAWMIAKEV